MKTATNKQSEVLVTTVATLAAIAIAMAVWLMPSHSASSAEITVEWWRQDAVNQPLTGSMVWWPTTSTSRDSGQNVILDSNVVQFDVPRDGSIYLAYRCPDLSGTLAEANIVAVELKDGEIYSATEVKARDGLGVVPPEMRHLLVFMDPQCPIPVTQAGG